MNFAEIADLIGDKWSEKVRPIPTIQPFEEELAGPVHHLPEDATPLDFFSLLWVPSFFQLLADQTNLYARQRQVQKPDIKWYPTTPEEMKAFLGINIIMGIDQKPALTHYWSTDPYLGNQGIQSVMPRERFEALTRYLHLNDSEQMPDRDDPAYDPLYKIRPLIDTCQQNFRDRYIPGREMSVDEGMIKYKGRLYFRQYMPKKPVKYGIKVWMAADSKTGYVCNYDIYLGKPLTSSRGEVGLATRVVVDLTEPFQHCNRHIYFDNFFTSVNLIEELLRRGTYGCGTLRANRYPDSFKVKKGGRKQGIKLKPGERRQLQKGTMLITLWYDKRQVAVLSSNCNPNEQITVRRRVKTAPHVKEVEIPGPVHHYNRNMGGVDLNDQYRSYYPSGRSGKKWWRFVFWFLVDVVVCNAYVVEGLSSHLPSSKSRRNHLQFKLEVAKQLIGGYSGRKRYAGKKRKATHFDNAISLPNLPGHHEVKLEGRKGACICCSVHNRRNPSGRTPETVYGCDRCGVHLCRSGCFLQYHTENLSA